MHAADVYTCFQYIILLLSAPLLRLSTAPCHILLGDFTSTHKITETVAIAAAGGCLPVLVLPGSQREVGAQVAHMLPYTRWLDWCDIAFLLPERVASTSLRAVLSQLAQVTQAEVEEKRRHLRKVCMHRAYACVWHAALFTLGACLEHTSNISLYAISMHALPRKYAARTRTRHTPAGKYMGHAHTMRPEGSVRYIYYEYTCGKLIL